MENTLSTYRFDPGFMARLRGGSGRLRLVGLTGGIASGKTTVLNMFGRLGAVIIDMDRIARDVVAPGSAGLERVVEEFGPAVLAGDGSLDRRKLRRIVFEDAARRKVLESIIHPAVLEGFAVRVEAVASQQSEAVILAEVPLLFEVGFQALFDAVVLVYIPAAMQIRRLVIRDGITESEAETALEAQLPIEKKRSWADYVIENDGGRESTEKQVAAVWKRLQIHGPPP